MLFSYIIGCSNIDVRFGWWVWRWNDVCYYICSVNIYYFYIHLHMNKEIGNDDGGGNRIPGCILLDIGYWIFWYFEESGKAAGLLNWIEYGLRTHWNEYCTNTLEIGMTKVGRWFVQRVIRDQVEYAWYGTCEVYLIRSTN